MTKYYITECLVIKNENQYLFEHITDNMRAGIDHFYIYDDNSDIPVEEYLKNNYPDLLQYCTITLVNEDGWDPNFERQTNVYSNYLKDYGSETLWCAFTDTDEIWEGDLKKFLKNNEENPGFCFEGLIHGANGHAWENGKSMKENFYDHVITRWSYKKLIVKTELVERQQAHVTYFKDNSLKAVYIPECDLACNITLHHYFFRSLEEFVKKIFRGSVNEKLIIQMWMFFIDNKLDPKEISEVFKKYNVNMLTHTPNGHNTKWSWSAELENNSITKENIS